VGLAPGDEVAKVTALDLHVHYRQKRGGGNMQTMPPAGAKVTPWQAIRPKLLWRRRT